MSLPFKHFVTVTFQEVMKTLGEFKGFSEEERLHLFRFKSKYQKEHQIFAERFAQVQKDLQDALDKAPEEEKSKIEKEFSQKLQEMIDLTSELTPLDYDKIKKADFSPTQLEILAPVLKNLPEA